MSFAAPGMLAALAVLPLLVAGYVALQRQRAAQVRAMAQSGMVLTGGSAGLGRRRHVPFVVFGVGLTLLLVSLARPQVTLALPRRTGTVILAFDASSSMRADDVAPTRLAAAQQAATAFVEQQPPQIKIGVVVFASGAQTVTAPTDDRAEVIAAIERISANGGTAVGAGLFNALGAIAGSPIALTPEQLEGDLGTVQIGFFPAAAVVLLSDGENTGGADPLQVAQLSSNAGVKVTTIGLGSAEGAVIDVDGYQVATALDEETLRGVAEISGGRYHRATDAAALAAVYEQIELRWERQGERTEITALLAAAAALLVLIGGGLSMRWLGRVV